MPPTYRYRRVIAAPRYVGRPIKVWIVYGQSRANNQSGEEVTGTALDATKTAFAPGRLLMLNNARKPGHVFEGDFAVSDATGFLDAQDGLGSGAQVPLGQSLLSAMDWLGDDDATDGRTPERRVMLVCGEGGRPISQLVKGAAPYVGANGTFVIYDRMLRMVTAAKNLAAAMNRPIEIEKVLWLQGEADADAGLLTPKATYKAAFLQLVADMRTDLKALTGQTSEWDTWLTITPSTPTGVGDSGIASDVLLAQAELADEDETGRLFLRGPDYSFPFRLGSGTTTEHMSKEGIVRLGEDFGYRIANKSRGNAHRVLRAVSATRTGSVVEIACDVPVPPLLFNASDIPLHSGTSAAGVVMVHGIDASGGGVYVTGASPAGDSIIVSLSGVPSGAVTISGGLNGMGNVPYTDPHSGRSDDIVSAGGVLNFCDSLAVPNRLTPGYIRNWLLPFQFVV